MNSVFLLKVLMGQLGFIIIIACVSAIILIVGTILLCFFLHRKSYKSNLKKYRTSYQNYKDQLTTTCSSMITRISTLAKTVDNYKKLYTIRNEQRNIILNETSEEVFKELNELEDLLKDKKFKAAKTQDKYCKEKLNTFIVKVTKLNDDLTLDLKEDEDTRNASLDVKKRYRTIKDFYKAHISELSSISSFTNYFETVDNMFIKFEEKLDIAKYHECLSLLPKIEKEIEKVETIIEKLPTIETLINKVIPSKADQVNKEYEKLINEGYIINSVNVNDRTGEIKKGLLAKQEQILKFNLLGVEDTLNDYQKRLTDIQVLLDSEVEAKDFYTKNRKSYIQESYDIEKSYNLTTKKIASNCKVYKLNQEKIDEVHNKKNNLDIIKKYQRKLENYDSDPIDEPYTVIAKCMKFLKKEIDTLAKTIKDYDEYVNDLNTKAESIFEHLKKHYIKLKEAESVVRYNINLEVYTEQILMNFDQLYKTIALIQEKLVTKPIDIEKIEPIYNDFKFNCETTITEVENKAVLCKEAEESITKANLYRIDFADCRKDLDEAEKYFNEGDFFKAKEFAQKVLKSYSSNTY